MQIQTPIRVPSWFSTRRHLEQKLTDLHKCTDLNQVKQLHALIYKTHLHDDLFIVPKLMSAFSISGKINLVVNVFNQIKNPNVHLYNALIKAYVRSCESKKALSVFVEMGNFGVFGDNYTYPFLLKAFSGELKFSFVKMVHAHIEKLGLYADVFVTNGLIDAYCKCGVMGVVEARRLFQVVENKDVVSWNTMIRGLVKLGEIGEARKMFDEMDEKDTYSWNSMLDGYAKTGKMNVAFELFERMSLRNVVSWSTMVMGYCKAGDIEMARMLFDRMPVKNLVSWTIIISAYAEKGLAKEAIGLYKRMEQEGLRPDNGSIVSMLTSCAESGMLGLGKRVHGSIERFGYKCCVEVNNALIDMYAKCGNLSRALSVFEGMMSRDLVSWNVMIHGLAVHGQGEKALHLFSKMMQEGILPDTVTFVGVLCACCHAGLLDEGVHYFYTMEREFGVVPEIEHYGCAIDLLGRRGRLQEAVSLIDEMPFEPNVKIWGALLGACRKHNAVGLAEEVQRHILKFESTDAGTFSMLSNIYAAAGDWDSVSSSRLRVKRTGSRKRSGVSSIMLDDGGYEFSVMDTSHPNSEEIYQMVGDLSHHLKQLSSLPNAV
ncbi:hypothetical protein LIER_35982 [Lithospermum erythrorhizon]|uniref:Pentatricopeptide repeat-containing protein n=1 Tax=Lithospermum erythrorhizon TaxID=34254 RepID=A0AAV3P0L0_LITER